jgi:hypothetical protein
MQPIHSRTGAAGEAGNSQFPFWDFFECNEINLNMWFAFLSNIDSQFPFWDFFECNVEKTGLDADQAIARSQFPFWDFFECNLATLVVFAAGLMMSRTPSQFPFWDFFECNTSLTKNCSTSSTMNSQFPFWDFFECNPAVTG